MLPAAMHTPRHSAVDDARIAWFSRITASCAAIPSAGGAGSWGQSGRSSSSPSRLSLALVTLARLSSRDAAGALAEGVGAGRSGIAGATAVAGAATSVCAIAGGGGAAGGGYRTLHLPPLDCAEEHAARAIANTRSRREGFITATRDAA